MAAKNNKLRFDSFVDKVKSSSNNEEIVHLFGYIGSSEKENYFKLYTSIDLNFCIEICYDDLLYSQASEEGTNKYGGSDVWIKKSSSVDYVKTESKGGDNSIDSEWFSRDCLTIGSCTNGPVCNFTNGCPARTEPGYNHPYCKKDMNSEWFSRDCLTIGSCTNGPVCNYTNGCPARTEPGYNHPYCKKDMNSEWFSRDCLTIGSCTNGPVCNYTNGCPARTEPGYNHPYCKNDVNSEWFSRGCLTIGTCTDGPVCNYTNGCPKRTEPGYHPLCDKNSYQMPQNWRPY